jgi:mannosyltransferase OCH1-like enzyme
MGSADLTERAMNRVIQGLWIGPQLSVMEQLSIASFLRNGHEYHLYVYDEIEHVPRGTVFKDANKILPSSKIFKYKQQQSYAGFANFFRYKLLLEQGGWWADTDTICLKPFDFPEPHVFATEICSELEVVTSAIIKAPIGSEAMGHAWDVCQSKDPEKLVWGETGPRLIAEAVQKYSLERYAKAYHVFCPLGHADWPRVLEPETEVSIAARSYAIHLWNENWKGAGQDKNAQYPDNCFYEQLKRRYLNDD